ncbi:MAG: hypothetical protein WC777_06340 [Candidatus Gracilibacteria bacterium]
MGRTEGEVRGVHLDEENVEAARAQLAHLGQGKREPLTIAHIDQKAKEAGADGDLHRWLVQTFSSGEPL